ncbi:hypothetical protein ACJJIE_09095 [Microbulbifer sp. TRSA001]|uniref:hypothetical protein n=1 Tax=Microbulbifer sp. TRSA001 TaxID=3243381 RepID=UPI004039CB85
MTDYNSIKQHIHAVVSGEQAKDPLPFVIGGERLKMPKGLSLLLDNYLKLVDWSNRHLERRKRGCTAKNTPLNLERISISLRHWLYLNRNFESRFKRMVGSVEATRRACGKL